MGTYVMNTCKYGKVSELKSYGAEEIPTLPLWTDIETDKDYAYLCVVYAVEHEAALLIESQSDILALTNPTDQRPRVFMRILRATLTAMP